MDAIQQARTRLDTLIGKAGGRPSISVRYAIEQARLHLASAESLRAKQEPHGRALGDAYRFLDVLEVLLATP